MDDESMIRFDSQLAVNDDELADYIEIRFFHRGIERGFCSVGTDRIERMMPKKGWTPLCWGGIDERFIACKNCYLKDACYKAFKDAVMGPNPKSIEPERVVAFSRHLEDKQ